MIENVVYNSLKINVPLPYDGPDYNPSLSVGNSVIDYRSHCFFVARAFHLEHYFTLYREGKDELREWKKSRIFAKIIKLEI